MQGIQTIAQQVPMCLGLSPSLHACQLPAERRTPAKAAMPDCRLAAASCQLFLPAAWTPKQRTPKLSGTWTECGHDLGGQLPGCFPSCCGIYGKGTC